MPGAWVELRRKSDRLWLLGACLLLVSSALVYWRDNISQQLVPDSTMNRQLERAQAALARDRLSASDGSGAKELFEAVLATDPDQMTARRGLIDVRNAAVAKAQLALGQHHLLQARQNLDLAQSLSAPTVQLQPLRARLEDLEEASGNTAALLAQAATPGIADEKALVLLDQVLRLDADNPLALEGRRELLARWLARAETLLAANQVAAAQLLVDKVIAEDPAHLDLPGVQAFLGEALARAHREQARSFELAHADERAGRPERAANRYLQSIAAGGDSDAARQALHRLAVQLTHKAQRQAADFQFRQAELLLAKARRWSPGAPEIDIATQRLAQSRMAQKRLLRSRPGQDQSRLPSLVTEAEQAMARKDFITPPGTSAWDKLRVASAIAPNSPTVLKLQREFARQSMDCFEQSLTAGHLKRAQSCLEATLAQNPSAADATGARQRLAERWLAYAEERIAASDYDEAEKALAFIRHWQPTHPKLRPTAQRLRRARGGSP